MPQSARFAPPAPIGEILVTRGLPQALERLFAGFETHFAAATHRVEATIGGDPIQAASTLPSYAETARWAWADDAPAAEARDAPACRILVARAGVEGMPGLPCWGEAWYRERAVEAALDGTRWRLHHMPEYDFWQIHDRASGRGMQLMRDPETLPPWDGGSPLRNFLHWHFMHSGRALVHAGTLGLDGAGMLLAGAGGSGKSGTVLAGVMHGLQTVGDDYVLADRGDGITAAPLFRTLKQDPAGFARLGLGGNAAIDPAVNWQGKHQFTLDAISDAAQPASMRMRALCLPTVAHAARTSFHPVSAKEAFLALAPSGVSQIPGDRGRAFAFCAELVRTLPAYRMALGTEPDEIAAAVAAFLKEPTTRC